MSKAKEYTSKILSEYKYDSNGNRIEETGFDNTEFRKYVYSNFNNKGNFRQKLTYDKDNQLIVELTVEYYPDGDLVKTEYIKGYKYGQQYDDTKIEYTYDANNNNMLTKRWSSTGMGWIETPNNLSEKEKEQYIKERYFGKNLKLESTNSYITYTYDSHNNQTYICHYTDREIPSFLKTEPCGKTAAYQYNAKGDWTEKIIYYDDKPSWIVVRDIEYY